MEHVLRSAECIQLLYCLCLFNTASLATAEDLQLSNASPSYSSSLLNLINGLQLTADDIAKTLTQMCGIGNTDRATARAALKRAIQENMRGKEAITNRAAEILLLS